MMKNERDNGAITVFQLHAEFGRQSNEASSAFPSVGIQIIEGRDSPSASNFFHASRNSSPTLKNALA
jgi:hypothetical protein